MFHYITTAQYHEEIDAAIAEQHKKATASKEAAAAFIDSLGIRHLLVPMTEEEIKAAEEKRANKKQ